MARRPADARPQARRLAAADHRRTRSADERGLHGRPRRLARRPRRSTRRRSTARRWWRSTSRRARSSRRRRSPAEAYTCRDRAGRRDPLRLALGRREVVVLERRDARSARRDRGRRAPERDAALEGRRAGSSSPAPTRTRSGSWTSRRAQAIEQIGVALSPKAPPGSTPNALALSPDGETLLVANADNNTVAVVDVDAPGDSRFLGFIPTGWYPTGVAFDRDGENVLVLSGKGLTPVANPRGPQPDRAARGRELHRARCSSGALSVADAPDAEALAELQRAGLRDQRLQRRPARRAARRGPTARRSRARSASRRRSSTSSTSSARTAPTTRCSATCRRATATRTSRSSART